MKRMTFLIFEGVTVLELEDRQISICVTLSCPPHTPRFLELFEPVTHVQNVTQIII